MVDIPKLAISESKVEELRQGPEDRPKLFDEEVHRLYRDRCSNCGGTDRLRVRLVVPVEAGGQFVVSNSALLCRPCEMALDTALRGSKTENRRILNFWVSRKLYDRLQARLNPRNGFNSMGAIVRYLMSKYVADEARFDDLEQYQDVGADVKINVWVDVDTYRTFKILIDNRSMTVTDGVKGLVLMGMECTRYFKRTRSGR